LQQIFLFDHLVGATDANNSAAGERVSAPA